LEFTGEYRHTIDAKGRLIVPSPMRDALGGTVYLCRWMEECIAMWSEEGWEEITTKLRALPMSQPGSRRFVRWVMSSAHRDEVDKQGRITVPQKLRDIAGITRDATVIGALGHAEIWDPARLRDQDAMEQTVGFEELAADLDF
jgi:MraZ protein